jgi:Spy/CpxP family protein refolding chaperone
MSRRNSFLIGTLFCLITSGLALAQDFGPVAGPGGPDPAQGPGMGPGRGPGGPGFGGPPMERAFHDGQFGRWWNNPEMAQKLGITDSQKKQMDDIFLQHRLKLIDLNANLEKQETLLHPMIEADQPDEAKILAQIDAVAQARAELEKANARMLFEVRKALTPDQWQKLKAMREEHRDGKMMRDGRRGPGGPGDRGGPGGPDGQNMWRKHRQAPPPDGAAPPPAQAPPAAQPQ